MGKITVKVFTMEHGLEIIPEVVLIRIKSKQYNLLIMEDYLPLIGEIHGSLEMEGTNVSRQFPSIDGYYMMSNNVFQIILEDLP